MKRIKLILGITIGALIVGVIGVQAATLISSSQVLYKDDITVNIALDELFEDLNTGKQQIADTLTNHGIETSSSDTFDVMANNIDALADSMYSKGKEEERSDILNNISIGTQTYTVSHTFYGAGTYFDYTVTDFDAVASATATAGCINVGDGSSTGSATLTVTVLDANTIRINCVALPDSSRTHGGVKITVTGVNVE